MKLIVGITKGSYTFSTTNKTITLSKINMLKLEQISMIINATRGIIMYMSMDSNNQITIDNNVITLTGDLSGMTNNDNLQIFVDYPDLAYDPIDDMYKIKTMQKKFRDGFPGSSLDMTKWYRENNGMTELIAASTLSISMLTTANASYSLLSKETFTIPFKLSFGIRFTQKIANQSFMVSAISVDPETGMPDGKNACGFLFDGTNATQAKYYVQSEGETPSYSAAVTVQNTTNGTSLFEIEPFCDEVWFHGKIMDSVTARNTSYVKHLQLPNPNAVYKILIHALNGSTAPASSTMVNMFFVACQDYAEVTAEITAGRGQSSEGQALGVRLVHTPTVSVTSTTQSNPTAHYLTSAASTNLTSVKTSAGNIYNITLTNYSASDKYFKLYNKASAPVLATDVPVMTIRIPAGNCISIPFYMARRHATGIAYAITGAMGDTDTTVLAAGDVKVAIDYI